MWRTVYQYAGGPDGAAYALAAAGCGLLLASAWWFGRFFLALRAGTVHLRRPSFTDRGRALFCLMGALAAFSLARLEQSAHDSLTRVAASGQCPWDSGRLTAIRAPDGGGEGAFAIDGRWRYYGNHDRALSQPLCTVVPVCVGDQVRVCAVGDDIVRIEKRS